MEDFVQFWYNFDFFEKKNCPNLMSFTFSRWVDENIYRDDQTERDELSKKIKIFTPAVAGMSEDVVKTLRNISLHWSYKSDVIPLPPEALQLVGDFLHFLSLQ